MNLMLSDRRGITLIELIIFIIIAGIFVPFTYMAFTASTSKAMFPEATLKARFVAEETMEYALQKDFTQLESVGIGDHPCSDIPGVSVPAGYSCILTLRYVQYNEGSPGTFSAAASSDYIMLAITVTPPAGTGYADTVQTIVSRRL